MRALVNFLETTLVDGFFILLASFLLGLASKLPVARKFGAWLECNSIGCLPLCRVI